MKTITDAGKKFIILGSTNAITYKEVWGHIQNGRLWQGVNNSGMWFEVPDHYTNNSPASVKWEDGKQYHKLGNISWFTNIEHGRRREELPMVYAYESDIDYPLYDGYRAILSTWIKPPTSL